MANKNKGFIIDDLEALKNRVKRVPRVAGVVAVKYFKGRIDKQQDVDGKSFKKRRYTTKRQAGKRILSDRGNMRDSIRYIRDNAKEVLVGIQNSKNDAKAQAHNEGAEIPVTPKMRKYFWAMAKKHQGTADGQFYKAMALKKTPIKIPKRQFIGDSKELENEIEKAVVKWMEI